MNNKQQQINKRIILRENEKDTKMSLTNKEIELVYLGASIGAGCKPCTSYHFQKAKEVGASDKEIKTTITVSINIRDAAKKEMENHTMKLLGTTTQDDVNKDNLNPDRLNVLVSIGSAFTVNCTSTLNNYFALGKSFGITNEDLNNILRATKLVKMKAASFVDKITLGFEETKSSKVNKESKSCCC